MAAVGVHLSKPVTTTPSVATTRMEIHRLMQEVQAMHISGRAVSEPTAPHHQEHQLYHFDQQGPKARTQFSILAPNSSLLPPCLQTLSLTQELELLLCPAFDAEQQCGLGAERDRPLTLQRWVHHRLGHISRSGPANSATFILVMFLKTEVDKLVSAFGLSGGGGSGSLVKFPGTEDFYYRLTRNLEVMSEWLGPASHMLTTGKDIYSEQCLVTWVSHYCGSLEHPVQVWHQVDEVRLLHLLAGAHEPVASDEGFYCHMGGQEDGGGEDNCPYHVGCSRSPIEDWRPRSYQ